MRPPWICASTLSGFTTVPQSTAAVTRRIAISPSLSTSASRIAATYEPNTLWQATPRGKRASPARLLRCKIEAGEKPRLLLEMRAAEGKRILPRGMRQLVDETLDDEDVVTRTHASPEASRHGGRLGMDI